LRHEVRAPLIPAEVDLRPLAARLDLDALGPQERDLQLSGTDLECRYPTGGVDHPLPGDVLLLVADSVQDGPDLTGGARCAGHKRDLTVSHDLSLRNGPDDLEDATPEVSHAPSLPDPLLECLLN